MPTPESSDQTHDCDDACADDRISEFREIAIALIVLELLRNNPLHAVLHHLTPDGRLKDLDGGAIVRRILERQGVTNTSIIEHLVRSVDEPEVFTWDRRNNAWRFECDCVWTSWTRIHRLLKFADQRGQLTDVAQRLIRSALQLQFEGVRCRHNWSVRRSNCWVEYSVNDSRFLLPSALSASMLDEYSLICDRRSEVYVLVPEWSLDRATTLVELADNTQLCPRSIESFVSHFLEMAGTFRTNRILANFNRFIADFNSCKSSVSEPGRIRVRVARRRARAIPLVRGTSLRHSSPPWNAM